MGTSVFLGASILHQATFTLTDAQIKALPTTGVENIIAAAGENKAICPSLAVLTTNFVTEYSNVDGGDASYLTFSNSTLGFIRSVDLLDVPDRRIVPVAPSRTIPVPNEGVNLAAAGAFSSAANGALNLSAVNGSGDFTGGNAANTMTIYIAYYILNLTTGLFE